MLERKEILKVVQNELLDVSDKLTSIQDCIFVDDAKITIVIKDRKIDLEYSESDLLKDECYSSFKFESLPYECLVSLEVLKYQIKTYLQLALEKQQNKLNYDLLNLNNVLTDSQKESFLSSSKITLVIERSDNNIKVNISSSYN